MSSRVQGCGGSGDMQGHAGAATIEGRGQEDGNATRRVPEGRPGGWPSENVHPCYTLLLYVYLVQCPCLWDIVSCRVSSMHDARLLALRHC